MVHPFGTVILATCDAHDRPGVPPLTPHARLAGLTLLERAARTARAAGAGPLVVVTADERGIRHDHPRLPEDLTCVLPDAVPHVLRGYPADQCWLVLPVWTIVDTSCLRSLFADAAEGHSLQLPVPESMGRTDARCSVWLVEGHRLQAALEAPGPLKDQLAGATEVAVPPDAFCVAISDDEQLREAGRRMLLHASRAVETDGWVDGILNRHISRAFTRLVLDSPVTPNHVTLFHTFLGLLAAICLAWPGYRWSVLGAFLFQLSVALDCADGEIARLRLEFSRWGALLDVIGDNVVHVAVFLGIGVAAKRKLGTGLAVSLGVTAAAGIVLAVLVVWALTAWHRRHAGAGKPVGHALAPVAASHALMSHSPVSRPSGAARLDALLNQLTSRDFSVLVVAAALVGHLEWMLWLASVGTHVFWVGFLVLQLYFFRGTDAAPA